METASETPKTQWTAGRQPCKDCSGLQQHGMPLPLFPWTSHGWAEGLRGGWGKPAPSLCVQPLPGASGSSRWDGEGSQGAAEPAEVFHSETGLARITQDMCPTTKAEGTEILAGTGQGALWTHGKGAWSLGWGCWQWLEMLILENEVSVMLLESGKLPSLILPHAPAALQLETRGLGQALPCSKCWLWCCDPSQERRVCDGNDDGAWSAMVLYEQHSYNNNPHTSK